jgi:hypothetical protein
MSDKKSDFIWAVSFFSRLCGEIAQTTKDGVGWGTPVCWLWCDANDDGSIKMVRVGEEDQPEGWVLGPVTGAPIAYAVVGYCAYHDIPYEIQ